MYNVKQRMLAFCIIADIVPLGLYRQPLCKSRFTGMFKLSVAIILLCKISLMFVAFKRITNRVINLFYLRSFKISTQKKLFRKFQILRNLSEKPFGCIYN